jgi:hypothetical protein
VKTVPRRFRTLIELILPVIDRSLSNSNERALSRIAPVRTVRSQRRITLIRLLKMQEEFPDIGDDPSASHVGAGGAL